MTRRTQILIVLLLTIGALLGVTATIYSSLQNKIAQRLSKGWVIPPLELYSQGFPLNVGRRFPLAAVQEELGRRDVRVERDYTLLDGEACATATGLRLKDNSKHCFWLKRREGGPLFVAWDDEGWIQELWAGEPWAATGTFSLFPRLITQFYDGQPILQQNTPLAEAPLVCLQAVTAIEDHDFLEHAGVSTTGTLRALMRNLKAGRFAEGGSTITQQLVKNFFLTSKKTIKRKVEEQLLALMLESQLSKDQIFEMYLNVIYMGQNGPYQVRGFGSASQYYFDKPLAQLNLSECALLAALINNPGRYSPFTHADHAQVRRELVLHKMQDANMLNAAEVAQATAAPLPKLPANENRTHAPYFVMSALREFATLDLEAEEGARLYTTLDPEIQNLMVAAVQTQLPLVAARIKKPSKDPLQVAAVTVDLDHAQVLALIGGRDFRSTQFNRVSDSRRQIGSTVKPFVYLPAMATHEPTSEVLDEPFEWKTGRQVWKPKNYDGKTFGMIPYFFALAESLNIATAKVGQEIGLDKVAETLKNAGIRANIPSLPSLTLGALELSPLDVAQAYSTLARMGDGDQVHTLTRVEDLNGAVLFARKDHEEFHLDPIASAQVIGMLQQSLTVGTARAAFLAGLQGAFAGKTGTTSDTKDAWFAGFSPRLLTVVWVGFDDNTVMGLTGAGAALPVWIQVMQGARKLFADQDFQWPEGVQTKSVSIVPLKERFPMLKAAPDNVQLVFANDLSH